MEARIYIEMDNAAFEKDTEGSELARILRGLADKVDECSMNSEGPWEISLQDINGNKVGIMEAGT